MDIIIEAIISISYDHTDNAGDGNRLPRSRSVECRACALPIVIV